MRKQILVKLSSIKFNENSFSGSRVGFGTCEHTDGKTDMSKLTGSFFVILFRVGLKTVIHHLVTYITGRTFSILHPLHWQKLHC